jgi:transcriptional regulator with XRE-family HTH domain
MQIFGVVVRARRESEGVTIEQLAAYTDYSKSLTAKIEYGERMPSPRFIERAEELLKCPGVLVAVAPFLSRERYPSWFGEYADREAEAVSLCTYATHVLHGLLQTAGYARAVFSAACPVLEEDEIESRVEARLARQVLLTGKPGCALTFVMEEWILRRLVGGPATMKEQLSHLLELSQKRNVTIQLLPTRYETHAGFQGPFTLLETPEHDWLAYVEGQAGGFLIDDRQTVSELISRHGMIRSQALTPEDSAKLIERMASEL